MQFAFGDSLSKLIRDFGVPFSQSIAKKMFAQTMSTVRHMHNKGIAHRDLKLGNILLDEEHNCRVSYRI
jgi:NUAK family SNF1-like kinase